MKRYLLIAFLMAAASCTKPYINVDKTSIEVAAAGETVSVSVDANCEWTVSSSAIWVKPKRNSETGTLDLVIAKNSSTDEREAKLTLNGDNAHTVISVRQKQMNSVTVEGTGVVDITAEGQTFQVETKRNVAYEAQIASGASWLALIEVKSMSAGYVKFTAGANPDRKPREAKVTLKADDFDGVSFTVRQSGRDMTLAFEAVQSGQIALPDLMNEGSAATVIWNGKSETYKQGMYIDIPTFPMPVTVRTANLTGVTFNGIVGIDGIDFSGLE